MSQPSTLREIIGKIPQDSDVATIIKALQVVDLSELASTTDAGAVRNLSVLLSLIPAGQRGQMITTIGEVVNIRLPELARIRKQSRVGPLPDD